MKIKAALFLASLVLAFMPASSYASPIVYTLEGGGYDSSGNHPITGTLTVEGGQVTGADLSTDLGVFNLLLGQQVNYDTGLGYFDWVFYVRTPNYVTDGYAIQLFLKTT